MTAIASAFNPIQEESLQFNNPESQASQTAMGAAINGLLGILLPVGSVVPTLLSPAQFQAQQGNPTAPFNFILADGSAVPGSLYASVSGNANVPDLRGVFLRGRNYSRSGSTGNPDGDFAPGTYQADQFASHNHGFNDPGHSHTFNQAVGLRINNYQAGSPLSAYDQVGSNALTINTATTGINISSQGGNETRAKNVTVNFMIRIN